MKLKKFTPENCVSVGGRGKELQPIIKVRKVGSVTINEAAAELLNLKAGGQVIVCQDEDDAENWYIATVNEGGWEVRQLKNTSQLIFQSAGLVKNLLVSLGIDTDKRVQIKLAGQPTVHGKQKYFGILTNTASWEGKPI